MRTISFGEEFYYTDELPKLNVQSGKRRYSIEVDMCSIESDNRELMHLLLKKQHADLKMEPA